MYSKADSHRQIRIGLLVPAGNTTFEPDFHSAFSSQVSIHSHRAIAQRSHAYESYESMDDINEEAVREIEKLARARGLLFSHRGIDRLKAQPDRQLKLKQGITESE